MTEPKARHVCLPDQPITLPVTPGRSCDVCYAPLTAAEIEAGASTTPAVDLRRPIPVGSTIEWLPIGSENRWRPDVVDQDLGAEVLTYPGSDRVPRERILAVYLPGTPAGTLI